MPGFRFVGYSADRNETLCTLIGKNSRLASALLDVRTNTAYARPNLASVGFDAAWEWKGRGRLGVEWFYTGTQRLEANPSRVITRLFVPGQEGFEYQESRAGAVLARILALAAASHLAAQAQLPVGSIGQAPPPVGSLAPLPAAAPVANEACSR